MICLIECLDQVGLLFLSDLSRQKCTKCTGQQGFEVPELPTDNGEEKRVFASNKHRWRQATRCVGHEIALQTEFALVLECAVQTRSIALLPECAEYGTSLSARTNQKTCPVVGTDKDLALLRVRGEGQHNTIREVTLDEDRHENRTAHVRGMTSTPQCAM